MNKSLVLLATAGSAAMLLGAFGFQYLGDLAPCKMCIWQRWPHGIAVVAGVLALALGARAFAVVGALGALTTSAIGFFHAGVEQKFWEGPTSCTSSGALTQSLEDLLSAPLVRCDEIPWELFSISMAGWNGIISLGIFAIWVMALRSRT